MLFVIEIEVGLSEPAPIHHYLVPTIDLQPVLREVQKIPTRSNGNACGGRGGGGSGGGGEQWVGGVSQREEEEV